MTNSWLKRTRSEMLRAPAEFYGGQVGYLAGRLYSEFHRPDQFSSLVVEGLALEIIAETSRRSATKIGHTVPSWLEQAKDILDQRFSEGPSLVALAESVDVHPTHLAREFRRFYKCTVGEFIRQRRIEFACHQISTTDASLSDIALTTGFFDHSHFARTFKKLVGMTPRQYRAAPGAR